MSPAVDAKTTFKAEMKIIPGVAYLVAGVWLVFCYSFLVPFVLRQAEHKPGEPPVWLITLLLVVAGFVLALWLLMIFYVNADARRRRMNRLLWTLLVIFIPNAIGFILYFVLRQPIARPCPKCGVMLRPDFAFCPACAQALAPACPACHRTVETGWAACAFCGTKLA